jgi:hypothetical protein
MNPQQPNGYAPMPGGSPYDFITSAPPKPPRKSALSPGSNSIVGKLVLVGGGGIILVIVVVMVVNLLFGNKTNFTPLIGLTQSQQEIARTAQAGVQTVSDQAIAGAAINTRLTMLTQQQAMLTYLSGHKQKISPKQLSLKKDPKVDTQFMQAKATSTFDFVFTQVLRQELTDYTTSLQTAYKSAPGPEAKKLLKADFDQTQMLLKQWPVESQTKD